MMDNPMKLLLTVAIFPQCDVDRLQVSMQVVLFVQNPSHMYQGGRYNVLDFDKTVVK
jgi:hypothetical protein